MNDAVHFLLNGKPVTIEDPPPDLLLIDYLRSPEVGLTGAKKGCGQGGCGACTVILTRPRNGSPAVEHRAINSCLRPVCALGGLAVTTIEGTGAPVRVPPKALAHRAQAARSAPPPGEVPPAIAEASRAATQAHVEAVSAAQAAGEAAPQAGGAAAEPDTAERDGVNQVAYTLAMNNGTQCGYCSAGFVMAMSALLEANPHPTKREIEDALDGNICRCTGYRSILTGMQTLASDWSQKDEDERMKCVAEPVLLAQARPDRVPIAIGIDDLPRAAPVQARRARQSWLTPATMSELLQVIAEHGADRIRLVLANTSFGIYPSEFLAADVLVALDLIEELRGVTKRADGLRVGAATTYSELIEALDGLGEAGANGSRLAAAELMARRTAGTIVRNAASLAGNTMLVLSHIHAGSGAPFASDLLTALTAIDARISFVRISNGEPDELSVDDLIAAVLADPSLPRELVLTGYELPFGDARDIVMAQKVALREVNAHSIVNATTRFTVTDDRNVQAAVIAFGGIAPYPWRPRRAEQEIAGRPLSLEQFARVAEILRDEVTEELDRWQARVAELPSDGITTEYRTELAISFLYKALVNALSQGARDTVPPALRSSGEIVAWNDREVSRGSQSFERQDWKAPVGTPYVKLLALYQCSGRVHYTHETAVPPTAVNAAFVQSRRALAQYFWKLPHSDKHVEPAEVVEHLRKRFGPSADLVTHEDIPPGGINEQGMGADQPLLAISVDTDIPADQRGVRYVGQAIALAVAATEQQAIVIAEYVGEACVGYAPHEWQGSSWNEPPWNEPVLSLDRAIGIGSIFPDYPTSASFVSHVWKITRPESTFEWVLDKDPLDKGITNAPGDVAGRPCTIVGSTQRCGGQAHFYMETQACVAIPQDGDRLLIHPSTQSPMEMHQTAAMALGVNYHKLEVDVLPVGGGYGGKTEAARFVTGPTVVAARHLHRAVRLVMKREHDTAMVGKRHPFYGQYQIAIEPNGRIRGMHCRMWGDGGAFYDCSFIVANCIQLRADNAYRVPNFENQIEICRTNVAPNTAMRAFGDIQGKLITENAIDDAAAAIGMSAEEVRKRNLYERGDVTPFGQALSYCYMKQVWEYLESKSGYAAAKAEVDGFNAEHTWIKRGIAMVPVKYGSGYNFLALEQAAAHVVVNSGDGSVIVHQGGVEMGQGAVTVVEQVASYVLNVPMALLHVEFPNTSVLPNPTSTGASTGTSYNAVAVKQACEELRGRLTEFGYRMLKERGPTWCEQAQIDFWNHPEGWAKDLNITPGGPSRYIWQNLVQQAYFQRVSLVASFTAAIPGGETPVPALTFKPNEDQHPLPGIDLTKPKAPGGAVDSFTGFTYSAACSVVEIDVLTGEVKLLRSDIVYDMGWSLNPAIDIGQVEGAFVQGIGFVLSEQLVYEPEGDERGRLNSLNTWSYKPPAAATIPRQLNTYLFPRDNAEVPENPTELFSSKEVGEPPLVLASSVFFAVKYAVRASRTERGLDRLFRMDAPATPQEVRRACEVSSDQLDAAPLFNASPR